MISSIISRIVILVFGNLYPAYASYKAVKTKNVKEYVKWMMYWIVFALFTCTETFTDIFLSWFPFYYEIKIILVIWLLSPATRGSSFLYRKFVHPMLSRREQEIDEYINRAKEQSYRQVLDLGQKGVTVLMQTAIKGGGGIVNQLKKSYSLSDLTGIGNEMIRVSQNDRDELDDNVSDIRVVRRRMQRDKRSPHRSSSASAAGVYFSEVDINVLTTGSIIGDNQLGEIRSTEDISSGYSSGEFSHQSLKMQSKEGVHRSASMKTRPTRVTRSSSRSNVPKKTSPSISDESDDDEVFDTNIVFFNDKAKHIQKLVDNYEKLSETESESEFFDTPDFSLLLSSPARHGKRNLRNVTACSVSKSEHSFQSVLPSVSDTKSSWNNSAKPLEKQICNLPDEAGPSTSKDTYLSDKEIRGGKYHKKMAPPPPAPAIKATLVLQPGVVKNLSKSAESLLDKQVFLRSSVPRKSRSKSPSSRNSSALQKLLKLPKKITNASGSLKRKSWSDFFAGKMISGTKRQSKSTSNLENYTENPVLVKVPSQQSLMSVRSMTESPLAHRRLRIIRAYVDEDSD